MNSDLNLALSQEYTSPRVAPVPVATCPYNSWLWLEVLTQIPTEFITGCPGTWAPSVQMPPGKEVEAKSYNREGTYSIGKDPNTFAVCL